MPATFHDRTRNAGKEPTKTATAKLTAFWGIDYFQLEKIEDKWMIRHIIWQSHP